MKRLIRLTSRALGDPVAVRVYMYDDLGHLRRDAAAFNGDMDHGDTLAVTHAWTDEDERAGCVTMRFCRGHLSTEVIAHEMHHASSALYGATLPDKIDRAEVLNHYNEPAAYLHGQLVAKLVDRLYSLGYYGDAR